MSFTTGVSVSLTTEAVLLVLDAIRRKWKGTDDGEEDVVLSRETFMRVGKEGLRLCVAAERGDATVREGSVTASNREGVSLVTIPSSLSSSLAMTFGMDRIGSRAPSIVVRSTIRMVTL